MTLEIKPAGQNELAIPPPQGRGSWETNWFFPPFPNEPMIARAKFNIRCGPQDIESTTTFFWRPIILSCFYSQISWRELLTNAWAQLYNFMASSGEIGGGCSKRGIFLNAFKSSALLNEQFCLNSLGTLYQSSECCVEFFS